MALIKAGKQIFNTDGQLIIKKSRGNNCISLWKNTKTMYTTMQLSEGSILSIDYINARCKELRVNNCAWISGQIGKAEVGNSIMHQGLIEVAKAGNRCREATNVVYKTPFQEAKAKQEFLIKQIDETIDEINERRGIYSSPSFTDKELLDQISAYAARKADIIKQATQQSIDTIKIQGGLQRLVILEPNGRPVCVIVNGDVEYVNVGNVLNSLGTISTAIASNMIVATKINQANR